MVRILTALILAFIVSLPAFAVDANLRSSTVQGRAIRTTDLIIGLDPNQADASLAARTDTMAEVIKLIFGNPPSDLTANQKSTLRSVLGITNIGGGTTLPTYTQSTTEALFSRAGVLFWEPVKEVPSTPGTSGAIGQSLSVTGTGSEDYRWGETVDSTARSDIESVNNKADATRLGLAGLESELPDPPIPGNEATVKTYGLRLPASSGRAQWVDVGTSLSALTTALQGAVRLNSVEAGTDAEFQSALRSQSTNNTPIILHITADITGTRGGSTYSHAEGDIFWVRPNDDTLIHLFTLPEGGGSSGTARERVLVAEARSQASGGQTTLQLPTDYTSYENIEIITGTIAGTENSNTHDVKHIPTSWLALQQDGDAVKIGILDQDEAGSRHWLTWTPTTRTFAFGRQGTAASNNPRIKAARLYDGGPKGEKGDKGDQGDPGSGVDQTARDSAADNAAEIVSLARRVTFEPPTFTRDSAVTPAAKTIIAHVLSSALPAGTTHLELVIGGTRTPRVTVETDGAYTFTVPSTGVSAISRIHGTTTGVNIYFYNTASGGAELGDISDVMRLVPVPSGWRALTGTSPYTIQTTDTEFMIVGTNTTSSINVTMTIPRIELTTTAKNFAVVSARPDSTINYWGLAMNLNAIGTQLTVTEVGRSGAPGNWAVS